MEVPEIDPNFEPQQRARSNTWPLRPKEFKEEGSKTPTNEGESSETAIKDPLGLKQQKTSSRRNAWGNLSYADLITKAIQNSPEQRLTLSQIYDWMVQNVPYFKDKGDSNSSAGWKNSIRHNLSLHNRFMRIQNEGAGKSSWWVINPDAKPGKSPRRRATSMDTKAYEKKRGRVKKKVEQMRAALEAHGHHSPSGGSDYGDDMGYGDAFNLSPQDFRARTSSNASSIGGRLSPIQSAFEPDLHDNQVPPTMSPIPWTQKTGVSSSYSGQDGFTETLSESLAEMFVGEQLNALSPGNNLLNEQALSGSTLSTPSPLPTQLSPVNTNNLNFQEQNTLMPAPPPYPDTMRQSPLSQQHSPQQVGNMKGALSPEMGNGGINSGLEGMMGHTQSGYMAQSLTELLQGDNNGYGGDSVLQQDPMMSGSNGVSTTMGMTQFSMNGGSAFQNTQNLRALQQQIRPQQGLMTAQQRAQLSSLNNSLLRQALTQKQQQNTLQQQQHQQQQQQQQQSFTAPQQQPGVQSTLAQMLAGNQMGMTPNAMQSLPANSQQQGLPYDLDLTDFQTNEFDCDVDQIINQELKIDGDLDFNFDGIQSNGSGDGTIRTSCN